MSESSGPGFDRPRQRVRRLRVARVAGAALLVLAGVPRALAYYEDLDSPTSHSSFHYELARLLARAAGFSTADAELFAVANQTVDLLSFAGEPAGAPAITMDGTSRYAEITAKYFHFPRRGSATSGGTAYPGGRDTCGNFTATDEPCAATGGEIRELELWAMTGAASLSLATPTASIDSAPPTVVEGGSLVALAIYLHSLADSYSHEKCGQDAHTRRHCLPAKPDCPVSCTTEFWHGQSEYGASGAGVAFTKEAGRAMWQELKRYRGLRNLAGDPLWDDATATAFIDSWADTDRASARRTLALEEYESIATCTLACAASSSASAAPSLVIGFAATVTPTSCAGAPLVTWDFGDGTAASSGPDPSHTYPAPGTYPWSVEAQMDEAVCTASGSVTVPAVRLRRRLR